MNETHIDANIEKVLAEKGLVMTSTSGVSMYPMLRHRKDMVVIETVKRELKSNDVPLYRSPSGKLVLHRILKVKNNEYIIRGDNLLMKEHVKPERIIGVLKEFYRNGKHVDCATSRGYKLYIFYIRHSYYLRYLWKKIIRPTLGKIKRFIIEPFCSGQ